MARRLKYDGDVFDLDLDLNSLWIDEAQEMERLTGWGFVEFLQKYETGHALAQKAGAYIIVKRDRPELRFTDFNYRFGDVEVEPDAEEPDPTQAGDDPAVSD